MKIKDTKNRGSSPKKLQLWKVEILNVKDSRGQGVKDSSDGINLFKFYLQNAKGSSLEPSNPFNTATNLYKS